MPAHIKTMLTGTSLQVPVLNGEDSARVRGRRIYLIEHRTPARTAARVVLQFIGARP